MVPSIYDPFFSSNLHFFINALESSTYITHCGISGAYCWGFMIDHLEYPGDEDDDCTGCGACEGVGFKSCIEEEDETDG